MNNILYPNIEYREECNVISINTYLRQKGKDGKYYKVLFTQSVSKSLYDDRTKIELYLLHKLKGEVYFFIRCGIIEGNYELLDGRQLFILDENQYSEEDRIEAIYSFLPIELVLARKKKEDYPINYYMNYE